MSAEPRLEDLGLEEGALADAFEAGRVPDGEFTHADHVRVAWELLRRHPLGLAIDRMTAGIQTLAAQRGVPGLYHATITTFYVLATADRIGRGGDPEGFEAFAAAHPELVGPSRSFLLDHYEPETLDSDRARRGFVLPERESTVGEKSGRSDGQEEARTVALSQPTGRSSPASPR